MREEGMIRYRSHSAAMGISFIRVSPAKGYQHFLAIEDLYTKFQQYVPLKTLEKPLTDQGSAFSSHLL
jgi:hypothetical protein